MLPRNGHYLGSTFSHLLRMACSAWRCHCTVMPGDAASPARFPRKPILSYTFLFLALVFMAKQNETSATGVTSFLSKIHMWALGHVFWWAAGHFSHAFCMGTIGHPDQRYQGERNYSYYQTGKKANRYKHPFVPVTWEKSLHYLALWQCLMPNLFPGVLLQRVRFSQQIKQHFERKPSSPGIWSGTAARSASAYTDPVCSGALEVCNMFSCNCVV